MILSLLLIAFIAFIEISAALWALEYVGLWGDWTFGQAAVLALIAVFRPWNPYACPRNFRSEEEVDKS